MIKQYGPWSGIHLDIYLLLVCYQYLFNLNLKKSHSKKVFSPVSFFFFFLRLLYHIHFLLFFLGSNDNNTKFWARNRPGDTHDDIFGMTPLTGAPLTILNSEMKTNIDDISNVPVIPGNLLQTF